MVERVTIKRWPYGVAHGWVYRHGVIQPPLQEPATNEEGIPEISGAGCYQWTLVDGIEGTCKAEPQFPRRATHILQRGEALGFGKFAKDPIESVIERDPGYIKWALENVESFAVSPELLEAHSPEDPDLRIGRKFRNLNRTKIETAALG